MTEEIKNTKQTELSEQELDNIAGGVAGNDGGCIPTLPGGRPKPPILPPSPFGTPTKPPTGRVSGGGGA